MTSLRFLILAIVVMVFGSIQAYAARGTLVFRTGGCDYFVVETSKGYDVLEWYSGHDPDKGDLIVGDFEHYGFKTVYDESADREIRVWVEDYWLSKEDALEKLLEQCE
jgi:hypothetical protein